MRLIDALVAFDGVEDSLQMVRRVEATKRRAQLMTTAAQLDLTAPPQVRGVPEAWELLAARGLVLVRELAGQTRDSNPENVDE